MILAQHCSCWGNLSYSLECLSCFTLAIKEAGAGIRCQICIIDGAGRNTCIYFDAGNSGKKSGSIEI